MVAGWSVGFLSAAHRSSAVRLDPSRKPQRCLRAPTEQRSAPVEGWEGDQQRDHVTVCISLHEGGLKPRNGSCFSSEREPCWESEAVLRLSPLSDPVMVNRPWILSASRLLNIVSSGWSVSAVPGRPSLTHRCCILNTTARRRGPGPGLGEQRGSLRTPPITPKRLPGGVSLFVAGWPILRPPPLPAAASRSGHLQQLPVLLLATECHCCSAVLQPLHPPPLRLHGGRET